MKNVFVNPALTKRQQQNQKERREKKVEEQRETETTSSKRPRTENALEATRNATATRKETQPPQSGLAKKVKQTTLRF